MKARIATLASFTGVLVAGSAAAMVNSQVLHNAGVVKNSVQNIAPLTAVSNGAATTDDVGTVVVQTTATGRTPQGTQSSDVAQSTDPAESTDPGTTVTTGGTRARYRIGDAGDVVLDTKGDHLTVVSTDSSSGWRVTAARSTDALNSVVAFQSATRRVVFHASLLFGVVSYSVTTYDLTNGGAPVTTEHSDPTPTSSVTTTTAAAPPTVTTSPSTTPAPPTTDRDHHWPRPGTTTTEPQHHHSGDSGSPSTTTPRWGSGNGEDD